ncbi:unnamed protein product (macronuclear) [Paramecium tetraurelia]|uniref:Uncharacterized protein n=1 Tax=Paramecium tetraurelia TaxID=5888 RepID=A0E5A1_PARTE|nr:uncharacterized protein GSPATT00023645001 [Paramecium tetraurelia]CAK90468.1 unnamed protein product [Paramecium tetraurelia]|eukprot:XP_001457865.1 hypothetical protein (macronuclear) [Paramecium tetraurelia strain d4-2]
MIQSDQLNIDEKTLLETIDRISLQLDQFEYKMKSNLQVLILVGDTGSGKSTIFNFLCGAKFKYVINDDEEYLDLADKSDQYSEMSSGMKSVTKEPKYFYNETFNHLLIDFPGFHDTSGEISQLIIQMIFYKFITKSNVKIAYVLFHPQTNFISRGIALQQFIKTVFKEKNLEISKLALILNHFNENMKEEKLIINVQKQLKEVETVKHEWISVIRRINSPEKLNEVFSEENREKLWFELITVNEIPFQPQFLPYSDRISTYITEKSNLILNLIFQKLKEINDEQFILLQSLIGSIQHILSTTPEHTEDWFNKFINVSLELSQTFHFENDIHEKSQNFLKIFNFFSFFSEFISGYSTFEKHCLQVQQKCSYFLETLQKKIELQRVNEEKLREQQNRIKAEQQLNTESQIRIQKEQMYAQEYENRIRYEQQLKMEQQLRNVIEQDKKGMEQQYKDYCEKSLQIQNNLQNLIQTEKVQKQQVEQDLKRQLQDLQNKLNEMEQRRKEWLEHRANHPPHHGPGHGHHGPPGHHGWFKK